MSADIDHRLSSPMQATACALAGIAESTLHADGSATCVKCGAHIGRYAMTWSVDPKTMELTGPLCGCTQSRRWEGSSAPAIPPRMQEFAHALRGIGASAARAHDGRIVASLIAIAKETT
jgi:hypothetical protein